MITFVREKFVRNVVRVVIITEDGYFKNQDIRLLSLI